MNLFITWNETEQYKLRKGDIFLVRNTLTYTSELVKFGIWS
jgi:hypothetical protein